MKLAVQRKQREETFGTFRRTTRIIHTISVKLDVTPEEFRLIEQNGLLNKEAFYAAWEDERGNVLSDGMGGSVTPEDLIKACMRSYNDPVKTAAFEEAAKEACQQIKSIIAHVERTADTEEVIEF